MQPSEFNILITNVAAIASQTFALQCGEFATAMVADENAALSVEPFALEQHLDNINFQAVLVSGYESLPSLEEELNQAWGKHEPDKLNSLISQLSTTLPDLTKKLTGSKLKQWVKYNLKPEYADNFYELHQYIMSLFSRAADETNDIIREAIAFDNLAGLAEHETQIRAEHIKYDDLITAATIQSFKVFEWLFNHGQWDDTQIADILEYYFTDMFLFERIYNILAPTAPQYIAAMIRAQASNNKSVVDFLNRVKKVGI